MAARHLRSHMASSGFRSCSGWAAKPRDGLAALEMTKQWEQLAKHLAEVIDPIQFSCGRAPERMRLVRMDGCFANFAVAFTVGWRDWSAGDFAKRFETGA